MSAPSGSVVQRIAWVTSRIVVGKDRQPQGGGPKFNYRGIDDMINNLNPLLSAAELVIVPKVTHYADDSTTTSRGNDTTMSTVMVDYYVYGPEGDHVVASGVGQSAGQADDKNSGAAMSYAYKATMGQLFCIPTDDVRMDNEALGIDETYAGYDTRESHDDAKALLVAAAKQIPDDGKEEFRVFANLKSILSDTGHWSGSIPLARNEEAMAKVTALMQRYSDPFPVGEPDPVQGQMLDVNA